jgi:cytochrome P450 / NADPH-cytochrome P450 reductase
VSSGLLQVRNGIKDGLFTAFNEEPNWGIAHRVLVPAFGPFGIKDMFDEMYDIATQLVAKWARQGEDVLINVTDDFTRLTLDSIALCAMDKRFNSFYKEKMHPFVGAMVGFLAESGRRDKRTRLEMMLNSAPERQYQADIALMRAVAAEVIAHRRANPADKKDLLNAMLFGKDPKTGQRLTDDNIMNNMLTFLIAGRDFPAARDLPTDIVKVMKQPLAYSPSLATTS